MPIEIEDLENFKSRVEAYAGIEIFYRQRVNRFEIVAGKTAWSGQLVSEKGVKELESWLEAKGAVKVTGWKELAELFAK